MCICGWVSHMQRSNWITWRVLCQRFCPIFCSWAIITEDRQKRQKASSVVFYPSSGHTCTVTRLKKSNQVASTAAYHTQEGSWRSFCIPGCLFTAGNSLRDMSQRFRSECTVDMFTFPKSAPLWEPLAQFGTAQPEPDCVFTALTCKPQHF